MEKVTKERIEEVKQKEQENETKNLRNAFFPTTTNTARYPKATLGLLLWEPWCVTVSARNVSQRREPQNNCFKLFENVFPSVNKLRITFVQFQNKIREITFIILGALVRHGFRLQRLSMPRAPK